MNDAQRIAWLDQEDALVATNIRNYGVHLVYVGGGCCSAPGCDGGDDSGQAFCYTVGLFGLGHPELLISGTDPQTAGAVLNDLAATIRGGSDLVPGELLTSESWPRRLLVEPVPDPGSIVFAANRFYQRPREASVPVYQLTYVDEQPGQR